MKNIYNKYKINEVKKVQKRINILDFFIKSNKKKFSRSNTPKYWRLGSHPFFLLYLWAYSKSLWEIGTKVFLFAIIETTEKRYLNNKYSCLKNIYLMLHIKWINFQKD